MAQSSPADLGGVEKRELHFTKEKAETWQGRLRPQSWWVAGRLQQSIPVPQSPGALGTCTGHKNQYTVPVMPVMVILRNY